MCLCKLTSIDNTKVGTYLSMLAKKGPVECLKDNSMAVKKKNHSFKPTFVQELILSRNKLPSI